MFSPTIGDYIGALDNPRGVFRSLGEVAACRDVYGAPAFEAGNSAAVFRHADGRRFLKCYIRPNPHLRTIYDYVERERPALLPAVRLLRDELFVHSLSGESGWVDVVEGEWIRGETLAAAVARAVRAGDGVRLKGLAESFDYLWAELKSQEWAHGDLKPENIIVATEDGRPTPRLIDCDAMWVPELAGQKAAESGTPPWSSRTENLPTQSAACPTLTPFDKNIDDVPAGRISRVLHMLADDDEVRAKFCSLDDLCCKNI